MRVFGDERVAGPVADRKKENSPYDSVYTMGIASQKSGVPISVLREYESSGLLIPHLTDTNRRIFSNVDIENARHLRSLQKDHRLSLAALKFLAACLPCWMFKHCPPEDRERCEKLGSAGEPCWCKVSLQNRAACEQCRCCETYRALKDLENLRGLFMSLTDLYSVNRSD